MSDLFDALPCVVICPLTTTIRTDADQIRLDVEPSLQNGLPVSSQVAIEKIAIVKMHRTFTLVGTNVSR